MANDPAVLIYYKDILISCADWDADVFGWYCRLLFQQADKPTGLPDDLDDIALLAGVKGSQFERFKLCWKRTLEAKFPKNEQGNRQNSKMKKVIDSRKDYSEKQSKRGIIGFFIKNARQLFKITDEQADTLSTLLSKEDLVSKTKEERLFCYKRTLIALLGNVNVDVIVDNLKGGKGENVLAKFKDEPEWWRVEMAAFLSDTAWKSDFCKMKSISNEELTKRMNDWVNNIHLISDFKDCAALKRHFTHSYAKWVQNGGFSQAKGKKTASSQGFHEAPPQGTDYSNQSFD